MAAGYDVDVEQIRAHAAHVEAVLARFEAVKAASAHIARDDQAYGKLCGWISGILEGRHTRQDELVAGVENNLRLVVAQLRATAETYQVVDEDNAHRVRSAGGEAR
ncbi:excreted virulence factor EspC (type VII ESX diderm) [Saccharothrix saharensis]|uniref:Excreted virulence factor EspC (Type VII ESX diderm) n=1 Tax=Saccharothrix saharensis TaxID=571190 RepID=A0A543JJU0_9PSEU|nr:type VII secretion target [Saccharothrix saharensis]TQM83041.1 excreted virulence factor EspC (type VII ESX diderm) [Saccharothrix saharensis]